MACWVGTISGQLASKANSRRLVTNRRTKRPMFIKSGAALNFVDTVALQVPILRPMLDGDLRLTATIYYASRRPDLDESLLMDVLQNRIYPNDRAIKEKHIYWGLDPRNPRVVVKVEEIAA